MRLHIKIVIFIIGMRCQCTQYNENHDLYTSNNNNEINDNLGVAQVFILEKRVVLILCVE